ncbi:cytochrome P450 1A1 isoform X2 [Rhinolophus ferrumequinum]|uniref:cytochrome P450 1A1 isoform X2 n=1 Tax=Rhinolophus ferrumequinum TaxID=59479 RepID=UPI00140F89B0|nr:cytochrome P450 1A1 isoform X2 [Rhinolophus ferrumequinum]
MTQKKVLFSDIRLTRMRSLAWDHTRDITDALIHTCHRKHAATKTATLDDDEIISTVNDLFAAGIETVSTCLYWSFLYLIQYPEIQAKIQEEIDGNIGLKSPRFEDRKILPYTEAFINEIFRHASFLPFTIPHCSTADTTLNGCFIPRKTGIFINMYQVNHDEGHKLKHLLTSGKILKMRELLLLSSWERSSAVSNSAQ